MGHDERHQSSSSGVLAAVIAVVLIVVLLGVLAVLGAGYFLVRSSRVEEMVARERTIAELKRVGEEAHRAAAEAQRQVDEARGEVTPAPRLNFVVTVDREGHVTRDGDEISLDGLRVQLAKSQDETHNAFTVYIHADPECPVKHVIPVLDACEKVGDIDYRVKLPLGTPAKGNS
jgi:hypothetical protein